MTTPSRENKKSYKDKKTLNEEIRILIVEDDPSTRVYLRDQLKLLGFQVVGVVSSGEEALEAAQELNPSLIIMDINLPGIDGIETAKRINLKHPVPVIIVTGYSSEELTNGAVEAGVFCYLLKPVGKEDLLPAIRVTLERFKEFGILKKEVEDLKEALETRKLVERAKGILMKKCNISEEEAFRLLQKYSQDENVKIKEIAKSIITASRFM